MTNRPSPLISAEDLREVLTSPRSALSDDYLVLDASYVLPTENRDAETEFLHKHIPGAHRFNIDALCDTNHPLPHMLPSAEIFSEAMRKMGMGRDTRVVVYDSKGVFSAPRAWWMFRYFGHEEVRVLDGGLPAWEGAGGKIESGKPTRLRRREKPEGNFTAAPRSQWVVDFDHIFQSLGRELILDARPFGRFSGQEQEPRPGVRSGHIPGSRNIPFASLLDPHSSKLLPPEMLLTIFRDAGVGEGSPVVSCGSGVSACVLALGMEVVGLSSPKLYDGSWAEWGSRPEAPVDTIDTTE